MRLFYLITLLLIELNSFAQNSDTTVGSLDSTERCNGPTFPGGQDSLMNYLKRWDFPDSNLVYYGQGRVYIEFILDTTGKIVSPKIKKGLGNTFDYEALKMVRAMPIWIPMTCNGIPRKTRMVLPIILRLE